jgi:hypothetical protein
MGLMTAVATAPWGFGVTFAEAQTTGWTGLQRRLRTHVVAGMGPNVVLALLTRLSAWLGVARFGPIEMTELDW